MPILTAVDCEPETLLDTQEAAALARCSVETIRGWVKSGRLPAWRWGPRRIMVNRPDLISLLKQASVR